MFFYMSSMFALYTKLATLPVYSYSSHVIVLRIHSWLPFLNYIYTGLAK